MDTEKEIKKLKSRIAKLEGAGDGVVVAIVLDKSGSMESKRAEAISGFNEFVGTNKKAAPKARFVQTFFDTLVHGPEVETVENVQRLTKGHYIPGGMTALYDAIGATIHAIDRLEGVKKVAIAIITDGYENNSKEFHRKQIYDLVTSRQRKGWQFTFIGADIDAYGVAIDLGFNTNTILSVAGAHGTSVGMRSMTNSVAAYASGLTNSVTYDYDTKEEVEVGTK